MEPYTKITGVKAFTKATDVEPCTKVTFGSDRAPLHFHFSLSCTGEGNGNPLQYACLENPREGSLVGRRLWGRTELDTTDATWQQSPIATVVLNSPDLNHTALGPHIR